MSHVGEAAKAGLRRRCTSGGNVKLKALVGTLVCSCAILGVAPVQDGAAALIARIEAPQTPNRQGWDPYSLQELMDRFGVPGVSIAVIKDYQIHWTKGYGRG